MNQIAAGVLCLMSVVAIATVAAYRSESGSVPKEKPAGSAVERDHCHLRAARGSADTTRSADLLLGRTAANVAIPTFSALSLGNRSSREAGSDGAAHEICRSTHLGSGDPVCAAADSRG